MIQQVYNEFADSVQKIWKYQIFPLSLHPKHQEQSSQDGLANRAFYTIIGGHGGQYDVEELLTSKTNQIMSKLDSFLKDFGYDFTQQSIDTLIANFNREVGSRAGTAARLAFNLVNIEELKRRGIDVSAVYDGTIIKFAHHVQLDDTGTKLVLTED